MNFESFPGPEVGPNKPEEEKKRPLEKKVFKPESKAEEAPENIEEAIEEKGNVEAPEKTIEEIEKVENVEKMPEKESVVESKEVSESEKIQSEKQTLLGDFEGVKITADNRLELSDEERAEIVKLATQDVKKFKGTIPIIGNKTATTYDSKAMNFSTQTDIITTESGKRVFVVYDYPSSWVHRATANLMEWFSGNRMAKPSRKDWKQKFEEKSNVPTIENDAEHVVLMPYLPNINASDLFKRDKEMDDFGECEWVKDLGLEGKLEIAEKIIVALKDIHDKGVGWGEVILPNIIITADKEAVIVDPEMRYKEEVDLDEQKARDLRDIIFSLGGGINQSEGVEDYKALINTVLNAYGDEEIIKKASKLITKTTLRHRIFGFWETVRLGADGGVRKKIGKDFANIVK